MTQSERWVLTLPHDALRMTQNTGRGKHWTVVRDAKAATEWLVAHAIKSSTLPSRLEFPVSIRLVQYAPDYRVRDTDGLATMQKAVCDAMVKLGILIDDNYKYVYETIQGPIIVARDNPRFEVHIRRVAVGGDLPDG